MALSVFFAAGSVFATDTDRGVGEYLREASMQFGISGSILDLELGSFQGSISCKHHLAPGHAIRVGLNPFIGKNFLPSLDIEYDDSFTIAVDAYYLLYPKPIGNVFFYVGVGPTVAYDRTSKHDSDYSGSGLTLGINLPLGIEWFFVERISLIAEYAPGLRYYSHSFTVAGETTNDVSRLWFSISKPTVGFSVYFDSPF